RGVGESVTIVSDGVDRGVVRVPFLPQRGKRPWCVATDRVVRRAVAPDGLAGRLLERPLASPHVLAEPRGAEGIDEGVVPAVRRDLVAALDDGAHEARIALGDHAEDEERAAGSVGVAEIEEALGRRHEATGILAQFGAAHDRRELDPVVVLLDVYG